MPKLLHTLVRLSELKECLVRGRGTLAQKMQI
jgi:hypothetical protein